MRIVVVQTAFLGDLILSTPLLKQIKKYFECEIALVCRKGFGSFMKQAGLVDEAYEVEKSNKASYAQAQKTLNAKPIDYVICPHQSFRSALFVKGLKGAKKKVGFSNWWTPLFFHQTMSKPSQYPDALRQLSLLRLVSEEFDSLWQSTDLSSLENSKVRSEPVDFSKNKIPEFASMKIELESPLEQPAQPVALVAPGSVWNTKKWTPEGFQQVSEWLLQQGFKVVLTGSPAEHEVCEEVRGGNITIENRAGQDSLFETLRLMSRASVLISNDSGAMHLASLVELPTVTIFGPTVLDFGYRPWNQQSIAVQRSLDCRPCGKHGHKSCPIGTHDCMRLLPPETIQAAVSSLGLSLK